MAASRLGIFLILVTAFACDSFGESAAPSANSLRFATYNVSLYGKRAGEVAERLAPGDDKRAKRLARVIQDVRADVLCLNEIDHDADGMTLDLFADKYLAVSHDESVPIQYPYRYSIPSNTGVDSSQDLNQNGTLGDPNDAWGYGVYPGQYASAVLSRFPIDRESIRTFQTFRWSEMPGALVPADPKTGMPYYPDNLWSRLRLSSKNHADVPVEINGRRVHLLVSHPTPPVFDGPEDRNGCRNHDEIRFWSEYIAGSDSFFVDDRGARGGLAPETLFVILGDLNSDPNYGDGRREAISTLLSHPRVQDVQPQHLPPHDASASVSASSPTTEPRPTTTADFGRPGGLRVDYVLPSREMTVVDSGVYWPLKQDPRSEWISASDHRLVWVDLALPR